MKWVSSVLLSKALGVLQDLGVLQYIPRAQTMSKFGDRSGIISITSKGGKGVVLEEKPNE